MISIFLFISAEGTHTTVSISAVQLRPGGRDLYGHGHTSEQFSFHHVQESEKDSLVPSFGSFFPLGNDGAYEQD